MTNKVCRLCRTRRPLADFYPCPSYKSGYRTECKFCSIDLVAEYRQQNPEKGAQQYQVYKDRIKDRVSICPKCSEPYVGRKCKPCASAYMQVWAVKNKEKVKRHRAAKYQKGRSTPGWLEEHHQKIKDRIAYVKQECFNAYGGKCYCCGIDDYRFLTFDHINNDGTNHRLPSGKRLTGYQFYIWCQKNGYPRTIRLACFNCNCARAYSGEGKLCPHELDRLNQANS